MSLAIILMGVSGCGKTTVGKSFSKDTGWLFYDGDDFHPPENVAKMAAGLPLDDRDRLPWLKNLHQLIQDHLSNNLSVILACSALKKSYRDILQGDEGYPVKFVYLRGSFDLIYQRMTAREDHYMKPEMLRSQFAALEEPERALIVDAAEPVGEIITQIKNSLKFSGENDS